MFGQQAPNVNVQNVQVNSQVQTQVPYKRQFNGVVWVEERLVYLIADIFLIMIHLRSDIDLK